MASKIQDPDQVDKASTPTLSAFVMRSTGDHELAILMNAISISCKAITRAVRKAGKIKFGDCWIVGFLSPFLLKYESHAGVCIYR